MEGEKRSLLTDEERAKYRVIAARVRNPERSRSTLDEKEAPNA